MKNTTQINASNKTHPLSESPTKKDAENDPLRTRTQSMQQTSDVPDEYLCMHRRPRDPLLNHIRSSPFRPRGCKIVTMRMPFSPAMLFTISPAQRPQPLKYVWLFPLSFLRSGHKFQTRLPVPYQISLPSNPRDGTMCLLVLICTSFSSQLS